VLVVEDDAEALAAMLDVLEELGYTAAGVQSAEGALNRFCEGVFDVLIVDVGLPALSGIQLAESLRTRQDLPVIFATGHEPPAATPRRSVWLQKPFSVAELGAALGQALPGAGACVPQVPVRRATSTALEDSVPESLQASSH